MAGQGLSPPSTASAPANLQRHAQSPTAERAAPGPPTPCSVHQEAGGSREKPGEGDRAGPRRSPPGDPENLRHPARRCVHAAPGPVRRHAFRRVTRHPAPPVVRSPFQPGPALLPVGPLVSCQPAGGPHGPFRLLDRRRAVPPHRRRSLRHPRLRPAGGHADPPARPRRSRRPLVLRHQPAPRPGRPPPGRAPEPGPPRRRRHAVGARPRAAPRTNRTIPPGTPPAAATAA